MESLATFNVFSLLVILTMSIVKGVLCEWNMQFWKISELNMSFKCGLGDVVLNIIPYIKC